MLVIFRLIALLEGISFLILILIGVPFKYFQNNDAIVKAIGMPHGLLFIFYVFASYVIKQKLNWSIKTYAIIISAAVIPFGTFYTDLKYLRK
jgi:integral membrane protein